jgi:hypothetical protein
MISLKEKLKHLPLRSGYDITEEEKLLAMTEQACKAKIKILKRLNNKWTGSK